MPRWMQMCLCKRLMWLLAGLALLKMFENTSYRVVYSGRFVNNWRIMQILMLELWMCMLSVCWLQVSCVLVEVHWPEINMSYYVCMIFRSPVMWPRVAAMAMMARSIFFYMNSLMEKKNCKSLPKKYKIQKKSKNNVKISFEIVFLCPFGAIWQFTVIYFLVWPTVVTMATMAWGTVICLIYYESEEKYF